jgi:YYY domain-containing protein
MKISKTLFPVMVVSVISILLLKADFINLIIWWFAIAAIGIVFFPFTARLFSGFYDKGYLFSKTVGIAIPAYIIWLLSSFKILPFYRIWIFAIYALAIILIHMDFKGYKKIKEIFKDEKRLRFITLEESMFFLGMTIWAFIRGLKPEISGLNGLEKLMDFGFVNSLLNTSYMPPADIWFAGKGINYYYFGQYITAFLTKLTKIQSDIAYNLMMATLFSFAFSLAFALVFNITYVWKKEWFKKAVAAGLVAAVLLSLGGNLHTFFFTTVFPAAKSMGVLPKNIEVRDSYFFPDATRYIGHNPNTVPPNEDKTIHEFPIYSFVVADLHAHVINIPFVLTIIALIFSMLYGMLYKIKNNEEILSWKKTPPQLIVITFFIGMFHMSNYWDFPIYTTVATLVILYLALVKYGFSWKTLLCTALGGGFILAGSTLIALPFSMRLTKMTNGIGLTHTHSAIYQLLILWGYQLFLAIYYVAFVLFREKKYTLKNSVTKKNTQNKLNKFWDLILHLSASDVMVLILACSAIGLVIAPEFIYVKDIYSGGYYRSNTMFKLTYQSFMMFALSAGFISYRVFSVKRTTAKRVLLKTFVVMAVALPLLYPFYAINTWYGKLDTANYKGLDGARIYYEKNIPSDWKAAQWLKQNEQEQPVILEAFGDSYTDNCRISGLTGFPTVIGWGTHEWLWRNSNDVCEKRRTEVTEVYESADKTKTLEILEKYKVKYIILGQIEREKFKSLNESKLLSLGKIVYENQETKIIQVN